MDIRFPQPGSDEPDKVTVTGLPETVDNAIDHLLNLEEEYVSPASAQPREGDEPQSPTQIFFPFFSSLSDAQRNRD